MNWEAAFNLRRNKCVCVSCGVCVCVWNRSGNSFPSLCLSLSLSLGHSPKKIYQIKSHRGAWLPATEPFNLPTPPLPAQYRTLVTYEE